MCQEPGSSIRQSSLHDRWHNRCDAPGSSRIVNIPSSLSEPHGLVLAILSEQAYTRSQNPIPMLGQSTRNAHPTCFLSMVLRWPSQRQLEVIDELWKDNLTLKQGLYVAQIELILTMYSPSSLICSAVIIVILLGNKIPSRQTSRTHRHTKLEEVAIGKHIPECEHLVQAVNLQSIRLSTAFRSSESWSNDAIDKALDTRIRRQNFCVGSTESSAEVYPHESRSEISFASNLGITRRLESL